MDYLIRHILLKRNSHPSFPMPAANYWFCLSIYLLFFYSPCTCIYLLVLIFIRVIIPSSSYVCSCLASEWRPTTDFPDHPDLPSCTEYPSFIFLFVLSLLHFRSLSLIFLGYIPFRRSFFFFPLRLVVFFILGG